MDKLALLALDIMQISKAMYDRFAEAKKGNVTADAVRAELAQFKAALLQNDADATAELHKRFETPDK